MTCETSTRYYECLFKAAEKQLNRNLWLDLSAIFSALTYLAGLDFFSNEIFSDVNIYLHIPTCKYVCYREVPEP